MKVYEQYYMNGPVKVHVEFFIEQTGDTIDHSASLPQNHVLEQTNLQRVKEVMAGKFLGTSLEGLNLNTLRNATMDEIEELIVTLANTGDENVRELYEYLERASTRLRAYLQGGGA